MYDVVFNGPGGAKMLYRGQSVDEAQRVCSRVLRHNPGLKSTRLPGDEFHEGIIAQWDDSRNNLMMQLRDVDRRHGDRS